MIRTYRNIIAYGGLFFLGCITLLLKFISSGRLIEFNQQVVAKYTCWLILTLVGVKVKVRIKELENDLTVAYFFNHNSCLDIFMIPLLGLKNTKFIISESTKSVWPLHLCNLGLGVLYIPKKSEPERRLTFFKKVTEDLILRKYSVICSPEGQRDFQEGIAPFNSGVFHMCTLAKIPIQELFFGIPEESNPIENSAMKSCEVLIESKDLLLTDKWEVKDVTCNRDQVRQKYIQYYKEHQVWLLDNEKRNNFKSKTKSNLTASLLLVLPLLLFIMMLLTLRSSIEIYLVGQIAGALFFTQAFILNHEFGHQSMFSSRRLNKVLGYSFSFFAFMPHYNWVKMHQLHHKWAGWRDKDPTTENTFEVQLSTKQKSLVDLCWKYWIPLFSIGYRFENYWNPHKIKRHLDNRTYKRCRLHIYIYGFIYLLLLIIFPMVVLLVLPAVYLSFMLTDIIMLSQHSHIPMLHSNGRTVKPLSFMVQVSYTRSLILPMIISKYLFFNFNYHETHHAYPGLPCYHLHGIEIKAENSFRVFPWLRKVKSMNGVKFIFNSSAN
ncbi:MAG: hypothetical protein COA79_20680 [Planctomycetota bacterium]|nr:MAG: hypothetical protein COA79_20680 [Planctomycetota bacterium]